MRPLVDLYEPVLNMVLNLPLSPHFVPAVFPQSPSPNREEFLRAHPKWFIFIPFLCRSVGFPAMIPTRNRSEFLIKLPEVGRPFHVFPCTPARVFSLVIRKNRKEDFQQLMYAAIYFGCPLVIESNRAESLFNFLTERHMDKFILREHKILGIKQPSQAQVNERGFYTGGDGQTSNPVIPTATVYANDFLRGESAYLEEFTYKIWEDPLRWAFPDDIQTALDFDPNDRTKSDITIAELATDLYDFNYHDYGNPSRYRRNEVQQAQNVVPRGFYRQPVAGHGGPINFFDPNRKKPGQKMNWEQQ